MELLAGKPGYYPAHPGETVPKVAAVDDALLPARSVIATPNTELADMFMTEAARGCSRGCTYCVMRRSTNGGMRIVPRDDHRRHPRGTRASASSAPRSPIIPTSPRSCTTSSRRREVGISSLRADKLTDELVGLLARGGYRTLGRRGWRE